MLSATGTHLADPRAAWPAGEAGIIRHEEGDMTGDACERDILEEVRREFPDDAVMQEVHYVRLLHYHQLKGLSASERVRFFARPKRRVRPRSRRANVMDA
jgi:hypothetical protein